MLRILCLFLVFALCESFLSSPPPAFLPTTTSLYSLSDLTSTVSLVETLLTTALSPVSLKVTGDASDPNGSHVAITITSPSFNGLSTLKRQQLVYKALWDVMQVDGGRVHAVDEMVCKATDE